ncbi:MAG TPA: hypothetical protein VH370_05695 [Humisphaera sp.]|jgi:hypothetical protein|nr:hypothetical protein [Humisphaera sp.]
MFRLIRLASMVLLGYAIYEFVQGMMGAEASASRGGENNSGEANQGRGRNARGQFTGGEGEGQLEQTEEDSGARIPHAVGRGVVGQ